MVPAMVRVIRSRRASRDIVEIVRFTKERWGVGQAAIYAALIEQALVAIAEDPARGRPRDDLLPGLLAVPIRRPGQPARHVVFYRVTAAGTAEVIRVLHDAMDVKQHLP